MALLELNWRPDQKQLRVFGATATVAFTALSVSVRLRGAALGVALSPPSAASLSLALAALGCACLLAALAWPRALRPLYVVLLALAAPLGFVVSHLVLLAVFYGLLTGTGLLMRLFGWDPMARRFDRGRPSYWSRRRPVDDVTHYFHQY